MSPSPSARASSSPRSTNSWVRRRTSPVRETPLILAVDDTPENLEILSVRLEANGYEVQTAADGEEGLARARELEPDLILLDIMMPKLDGISVVRELKRDARLKAIPVILVTAKADTRDIVAGLDAGGDDYLTKPFEHADLIVASADHERLLDSHRQEVTVVFCDLRGFTAFAEQAHPEEVMAVLTAYHAALGELVLAYEGTLERFLGDGLVVLFNDPMPCPDHPKRAVRMALDMQARVGELTESWRKSGHQLGFGIGIAQGEATLGRIGFDSRLDYAAIGRIPNLASRLCSEAQAGQVLVSETAYRSVRSTVEGRHLGDLRLKGFADLVPAYLVTHWRGLDAAV